MATLSKLKRWQADAWIDQHHARYECKVHGGMRPNDHVVLYIKNRDTTDQWFLEEVYAHSDGLVISWPWKRIEASEAVLQHPDFTLEEIERAEGILASLS